MVLSRFVKISLQLVGSMLFHHNDFVLIKSQFKQLVLIAVMIKF